MINTYQEIDALFGAELSIVPKPQVPFKIKPWQIVVGGTVVILTAYGVYCIHRDFIKKKDANVKRYNGAVKEPEKQSKTESKDSSVLKKYTKKVNRKNFNSAKNNFSVEDYINDKGN
jgi:hypothetical protein